MNCEVAREHCMWIMPCRHKQAHTISLFCLHKENILALKYKGMQFDNWNELMRSRQKDWLLLKQPVGVAQSIKFKKDDKWTLLQSHLWKTDAPVWGPESASGARVLPATGATGQCPWLLSLCQKPAVWRCCLLPVHMWLSRWQMSSKFQFNTRAAARKQLENSGLLWGTWVSKVCSITKWCHFILFFY